MARRIFAYYQKQKDVFRDWYPAHIIFDLSKSVVSGQSYYLARFKCIEFVGLFGNKWESLGSCT